MRTGHSGKMKGSYTGEFLRGLLPESKPKAG